MDFIFFSIWWMVAVLPYLIFMDGFERLEKFFKKRGVEFTMLHYLLVLFCVLFIFLWLRGYR